MKYLEEAWVRTIRVILSIDSVLFWTTLTILTVIVMYLFWYVEQLNLELWR